MTEAYRQQEMQWEEIYARTGDNLAAAREILKDAGSVTRWSRKVREDVQRQREERQSQREARQNEKEARQGSPEPASEPSIPIPGPVVVVRLESNLDLVHSPAVLRLLLYLASHLADSLPESAPLAARELSERAESVQRLDTGGKSLVLDLRAVKMIDGSGVTCLISGRRVLTGNGHRLIALLAPGSQPETVFESVKLGRIITAYGSLDEL